MGPGSRSAAFSVSAWRGSRETAAYLHNKTAFGQVIHPDAPPGRHSGSRGQRTLYDAYGTCPAKMRARASERMRECPGSGVGIRGQSQTSSISSRWFAFASRPRAGLSRHIAPAGDCFVAIRFARLRFSGLFAAIPRRSCGQGRKAPRHG